ncbi:Uncharacterised protein [Vibrio cholerae]|nr:Uncharacterised protein [Vibrio cholerae]
MIRDVQRQRWDHLTTALLELLQFFDITFDQWTHNKINLFAGQNRINRFERFGIGIDDCQRRVCLAIGIVHHGKHKSITNKLGLLSKFTSQG